MRRSRGLRAGFTLVELIVALLIGAAIGLGMMQLLLNQSRFMARDAQSREARGSVASGISIVGGDLRMVEYSAGSSSAILTTGGSPSDSVLWVRLPMAFAIACDSRTLVVTPYDSTRMTFDGLGAAQFDGYALRGGGMAGYTYTARTGSWITLPGTSTACSTPAPAISTSGGGAGLRIATLATPMSPAPPRGGMVMLWVEARYRIGASTTFTSPPRRALFVRLGTGGAERELLAPLDTGARFRYFGPASADTALTSPPVDVTTIRGVQLRLPGLSAMVAQGRPNAEASVAVTSIFFRNTP